MTRTSRAAAVLAVLGTVSSARGAEADDAAKLAVAEAAFVTGGASLGLLALVAVEPAIVPSACRWCSDNGFDDGFRTRLVWSEPRSARAVSDGAVLAVPVLAAAALVAAADERGRRTLEDLSLVGASVAVTALGTQVAKLVAARQRPYAHHGRALYGELGDANHSFWSAHTALTMAAVTSAGVVAERRGYPAWPWMLAVGSAASLATGYLRVAADKHWATDVLAGAAFGALIGWGTPVLLWRRDDHALAVRVTPVGLVGVF